MNIKYKSSPNENWNVAKLVSRAGKATGKNRYWWNIEDSNSHQKSVDLSSVAKLELQHNFQ